MKRNNNGVIIYHGKKLDMYALMTWLIAYNNRNNTNYSFRTITEKMIKKFLGVK